MSSQNSSSFSSYYSSQNFFYLIGPQNAKLESAGKQRLWEMEQRHSETIRRMNSELSAEKDRSASDWTRFDSRMQLAETKVSPQSVTDRINIDWMPHYFVISQ